MTLPEAPAHSDPNAAHVLLFESEEAVLRPEQDLIQNPIADCVGHAPAKTLSDELSGYKQGPVIVRQQEVISFLSMCNDIAVEAAKGAAMLCSHTAYLRQCCNCYHNLTPRMLDCATSNTTSAHGAVVDPST